tara:strand:+ start:196 stop:537 length:342 start_codon:yes stop_codon:yes gene_type:complete
VQLFTQSRRIIIKTNNLLKSRQKLLIRSITYPQKKKKKVIEEEEQNNVVSEENTNTTKTPKVYKKKRKALTMYECSKKMKTPSSPQERKQKWATSFASFFGKYYIRRDIKNND